MRAAAFGACALAIGGCALAPAPERQDVARLAAPNRAVPAEWASSGGAPTQVTGDWLAAFRDPALEALVQEALAYNVDLRRAASRVEAAAAYLDAAGSALYPQVNLVARGGGKMSGDASGLQGVGLFATWELDLWGRVRAGARAAELQYDSARLDVEYARQSLTAMVTKAWVLAIEASLQKAQAEQSLTSSLALAALARDRLRVGLGDEAEVAQSQAGVEGWRDSVRGFELARQNAQRSIEALVGRYPSGAVAVARALPAWPGDVPTGLPSELLERRPDVVAAERRVALAFYRTEEAKAARLPRISLVANYTTLSSELFVLQERDNPLLSFGAGLVQPIFLGGYLQSQVDARTADQKTAIADYGKVSAKAFEEVEAALSAGLSAQEREATLQRLVRERERSLELAKVRQRVGSGDLRGVEQAQLELYSARVALLRVQAERLVQRVNLHLALGGGFETGPATEPALPAPAPAAPAPGPAARVAAPPR